MLNMIGSPLVLTLMMTPMDDGSRVALTAEQDRVVRNAVYDNTPQTVSPDRDFRSILFVPEPLVKLYKAHPEGVTAVLMKIIEGGRPRDSVLAAGYSFELLVGPGRGLPCISLFEEKTYDDIEKDWQKTSREHWIIKVRECLKEKVPDAGKSKEEGAAPRKASDDQYDAL